MRNAPALFQGRGPPLPQSRRQRSGPRSTDRQYRRAPPPDRARGGHRTRGQAGISAAFSLHSWCSEVRISTIAMAKILPARLAASMPPKRPLRVAALYPLYICVRTAARSIRKKHRKNSNKAVFSLIFDRPPGRAICLLSIQAVALFCKSGEEGHS